MRITFSIDDALLEAAMAPAPAGVSKPEWIREAILVSVRVEAGRGLAALGGQAPAMDAPPRRRPN